MPTEGGSFTNHPGVIDFRGKTYLFYHNGDLPGGGGFTRSVCVDELVFNADGSIRRMKMGKGIDKGLSLLNPYVKNEAETIAWSEGFKAFQNDRVGVFVTADRGGSYIKVKEVDFRSGGAKKFTARVGTTHNTPVKLEIHLDGIEGRPVGEINIPRTGGDDRWSVVTTDVPEITGVHDLYFVARGDVPGRLMYFDYWMFSE